MKFLIPTEPDDTHAALVKIALNNMGHKVRFLFMADQPTQLKNSVLISQHNYQWRSTDQHQSIVDNDYDVVWWRRARKPHIPRTSIHPEDYRFVVKENSLFFESLTQNMAPNAWWVNTKAAAMRANSKLLQLKLATECDMKIPTTLCSNDPEAIRYFILKHETNGVVYKPLCANFWFEEQKMRIAYTSKISFSELPSNNFLQLTPGIFQKEIKKKYELRVTCFGNYLVTAKLNSQAHLAGKIDWRAIPHKELSIEPYTLPTSLEEKIRQFMKRLGLVFGAFDFIVNEDNEYIFLEVNEQGQFLWIEDFNPDFKMLDIFINFLLNKSHKFAWNPKNTEHTMDKYETSMRQMIAENMQCHIGLNNAQGHTA